MAIKTVLSPNYNYNFNTETGFFMRWGETKNKDCDFSPIGPEILDIEVSEVCHQNCQHCYKSNVSNGKNMLLETFKTIIDKMPTVLQVAIGIGDIDGNPDLFPMMKYCRSKGVVPNITINGYRLTDEHINNLAKLAGAVAVSNYDKDTCYNAVKKLTDKGMKQVNIHQLLSEETYKQVLGLIEDSKTDERLKKLNAIVFLSLKKKGRGVSYERLGNSKFQFIVDKCLSDNINFGADSCTACKLMDAIEDDPRFEKIMPFIEPCESSLYSSYISVNSEFFPCSFSEKGKGIDVVNCNNFLEDVWYNPRTISWRRNLLANGRKCPIYNV